MYTRICSSLDLPLRGKILGISGLKYFNGSPNYIPTQEIMAKDARIIEADYPEVDMQRLPYPDNTFDFVIADQVIEHIEGNVQQAIHEARRVLKPGGIAVIATVFMYPVHWGPKDLWRFSTEGLRYLCKDFTEIVQCASWGNRIAHILGMIYKKSQDWKVPERSRSIVRWLATYNEPAYPHMTWIVAKK